MAHVGRKSSTCGPFINAQFERPSMRATKEIGGWFDKVVSAMGGENFTWNGKGSDDPCSRFYAPRSLSLQEIHDMVDDWARAAFRAVRVGMDVVEIHGAHGYLIHQFLSPTTNRRTDAYGGSFENRIRLLTDIIKATQAGIPALMLLWLRSSSLEWMDETDIGKQYGIWDVESMIRIAKVPSDLGVLGLSRAVETIPSNESTCFSRKPTRLRSRDRSGRPSKRLGSLCWLALWD